MKEHIERAAVKDEILSWAVCINHPELLSKEDTMHCIDNMPSANVAEVVRCRECKHYRERRTKKYGNLICRCIRMGKYDMDYPVRSDDFCSYGERR